MRALKPQAVRRRMVQQEKVRLRTEETVFEPPKAPPGYELWQHTKSKILHLVDHRFPSSFECGRKPGAFHTNRGVNPRWDTGICWRCFKHK